MLLNSLAFKDILGNLQSLIERGLFKELDVNFENVAKAISESNNSKRSSIEQNRVANLL